MRLAKITWVTHAFRFSSFCLFQFVIFEYTKILVVQVFGTEITCVFQLFRGAWVALGGRHNLIGESTASDSNISNLLYDM